MLILIITTSCRSQVFNRNRTNNQLILEYSILNRTESHSMELKEQTIVNVIIENTSGRVDILVADATGQEIYRGDNATSGKFSLKIPKTDTYRFSVTGKKAKGSVSFKVAD